MVFCWETCSCDYARNRVKFTIQLIGGATSSSCEIIIRSKGSGGGGALVYRDDAVRGRHIQSLPRKYTELSVFVHPKIYS